VNCASPHCHLMAAPIMGLSNRVARHQKRGAPFRLMRVDIAVTREGLALIALIRTEELEGFIDRLFGHQESLDLPGERIS
jgi:hypothetical protein